jgi:hypothetical protein
MQNELDMSIYFKECFEEETSDDSSDDALCLISGEILTDYFITLSCGHHFNYIPLFNEVYIQKCVINHREVARVPHKCVKCPYCRIVSVGILPYREVVEKKKIYGVNWPCTLSMKFGVCSYVFKSGKKKGNKCLKLCVDDYCGAHKTIAKKMELMMVAKAKKAELVITNSNAPQDNIIVTEATVLSLGELDNKTCSHMVGTKNKKRLCKNKIKDKGFCGIHLKLNEHIK